MAAKGRTRWRRVPRGAATPTASRPSVRKTKFLGFHCPSPASFLSLGAPLAPVLRAAASSKPAWTRSPTRIMKRRRLSLEILKSSAVKQIWAYIKQNNLQVRPDIVKRALSYPLKLIVKIANANKSVVTKIPCQLPWFLLNLLWSCIFQQQ